MRIASLAIVVLAALAGPAISNVVMHATAACTPPAAVGTVQVGSACPVEGLGTWASLPLAPGISGHPTMPAQYRKVADEVCLRGDVRPAVSDYTLLATLPPDFRPPPTYSQLSFRTAGTSAAGAGRGGDTVMITPNGEVTAQFSDGDKDTLLNGICFSTSA